MLKRILETFVPMSHDERKKQKSGQNECDAKHWPSSCKTTGKQRRKQRETADRRKSIPLDEDVRWNDEGNRDGHHRN